MKKAILILSVFLISTLFSQSTNVLNESGRESVIDCAENYLAGAHSGDVEAVKKAIHNEFNKVYLATLPNKKQLLVKAGYSRFTELVRADIVPLAENERNLKIDILAACENIACVKAASAQFYEYIQIVKINGEWKLVNTLFKTQPSWEKEKHPDQYTPYEDNEEKQIEMIHECAMNYIEGGLSGEGDRMEKAIHPQLNKVVPQLIKSTGREMLSYSTYTGLIEATEAGFLKLEKDKWNIRYKLLDKFEDMAMVEVISYKYYDYLHMVKINGEWKIVNVAWVRNPANI